MEVLAKRRLKIFYKIMIEYKLKPPADGETSTTIVKTGTEIEFTLPKIQADVDYLTKARKEVDAQVKISSATMENVRGTHPGIAAMSKEDLTAAYLYREALGIVTIGHEKITQIDQQLADYESEKVEIEKQTGLKLTPDGKEENTNTKSAGEDKASQ